MQSRHWIAITISSLIGIALVALVVVLLSRSPASQQLLGNEPSPTPSPTLTPTPTPDPLRPRTALLLGYMGGTHDGGLLTDTIMLAQANPKTQILSLVSIPRDLWIDLPIDELRGQSAKINTAFAVGRDKRRYPDLPEPYASDTTGIELAKAVVGEVTGQEIEFGFAVNQAGLTAALETLAPLQVDVPYSFTDPYYPLAGEETNPCGFSEEDIATLSATFRGFDLEKQFTCRYEEISYQAGPQPMEPSEMVKFVRSRHAASGGGDFGRAQRQQAVISAVIDKLAQPSSWLQLPTLITTLFESVESTITAKELLELATLVGNPSDWQVRTVVLDTSNVLTEGRSSDGQYILTVKPTPTPTTESTNSAELVTTGTGASEVSRNESQTTQDEQEEGDQGSNPWSPIHQFVDDFLNS